MKHLSLSIMLIVAGIPILTSCVKDKVIPDYKPTVDAGPSQTITFPVDTVRLNGTATDSGSRIVAYLWSEVSGPSVPVITSPGSKSTLVTGLRAGTYIFQLMAVDSLGDTGVDTVSVTVKLSHGPGPTTTDTLVLGPHSYEITYLSNTSNYPNGNPSSPEFLAEAWTINGIGVTGRSYFRFDLSGIPANTTLKSARLSLYSDPTPLNGDLIHANSGSSNDFYIQRVASSWDTTTAWANQPSWDTTGLVHIPQTNQPFLDLIETDVTAMANQMLTAGNYGFVIRLNSEVIYNTRIFCSGNYSDPAKRPRLIITF